MINDNFTLEDVKAKLEKEFESAKKLVPDSEKILQHLLQLCEEMPFFIEAFMKEEKTLTECFMFIIKTVQNEVIKQSMKNNTYYFENNTLGVNAVMSDEFIFQTAENYYGLDDTAKKQVEEELQKEKNSLLKVFKEKVTKQKDKTEIPTKGNTANIQIMKNNTVSAKEEDLKKKQISLF